MAAYQGQFIGPTLRVQPGDTVRVQLRNGLKEPTNLHSHGMFVSPIGISDNVLSGHGRQHQRIRA